VIGEPDDPDDDPSRDFCSVCGFQRVYRVPPPRDLGTEKTPATAGVGALG
jgi:hypothetical protein